MTGIAMPPDPKDLLGGLSTEHVRVATRFGLVLHDNMGVDAWSRLVSEVARTAGIATGHQETLTAWLGDLLAYNGGRYRGQITEYAKAAGLQPNTLRIAKLVCSRIPVLSRLETVSWSHHCEVAKAFDNPQEIERWLRVAEREKLSKADLRKSIRAHVQKSADPKLADPSSSSAFIILRELRAVDRLLQAHTATWQTWPAATCQVALAELRNLTNFVVELRARANPSLTS